MKEGWCSICGVFFKERWFDHRCEQKTLNRIDGAHKAAMTRDDPGWTGTPLADAPNFAQRLSEGFWTGRMAGRDGSR